jgi:hypothetical protein
MASRSVNEPTRPTKWLRRVVIGALALVLVLAGLIVHLSRSSRLLAKASAIKLGMTEPEVVAILGPPHELTATVGDDINLSHQYWRDADRELVANLVWKLTAWTGFDLFPDVANQRPVAVRFEWGKVTVIRLGDKIVESDPSGSSAPSGIPAVPAQNSN